MGRMANMSGFTVGDRVELKSCPGIHGTVTRFWRGSVHVRFDDFLNASSILRPGSLQPATDKNDSHSKGIQL
jgi:hypothetical protein